MEAAPKFLVIRFSSIGDIVLTTPVFRVLKTRIEPTPEIHFLTKKGYAHVLEGNPYIDRVHTIETSTAEVRDHLNSLNFDYVVDLHRNIRSAMVKRKIKQLDFTFEKQNFDKWLLVNFGAKRGKIVHVTDRYLACLKPFGKDVWQGDGQGLDFFISPKADAEAEAAFPDVSESDITLALGATHAGKRMTEDLLNEIITREKRRFILLGGPEDLDLADKLSKRHGDQLLNAAGRLSLHGSAALVRKSGKLVSGDTGMMHIGAALGVPVISVWGCTSPELGMSPYKPHPSSVIIEPHGRHKRPCSKLGDRCKYGKDKPCISAVQANDIIEALKAL